MTDVEEFLRKAKAKYGSTKGLVNNGSGGIPHRNYWKPDNPTVLQELYIQHAGHIPRAVSKLEERRGRKDEE